MRRLIKEKFFLKKCASVFYSAPSKSRGMRQAWFGQVDPEQCSGIWKMIRQAWLGEKLKINKV